MAKEGMSAFTSETEDIICEICGATVEKYPKYLIRLDDRLARHRLEVHGVIMFAVFLPNPGQPGSTVDVYVPARTLDQQKALWVNDKEAEGHL